jgi:hypothetical protein
MLAITLSFPPQRPQVSISMPKVTDPVRYGPYGHGSTAIVAQDSAPEAAVREVVARLRRTPASGSKTP